MEPFENDIEYRSPEEIKAFQEELLQRALHYLADHSAYYRRMFDRYEIHLDQIRHIEDLVKIPFTEKKDLQLFNEEFLCCPRERIIDYVTTSGTLGDPVTFGCTELDLQRLAYNEKKSFACAGLRPGNIVQLMTTLDKRFMAGLAYFLGIRELGASVIRVGNGIPELQWDTIRRIGPTGCIVVPSFLIKLVGYAQEHGIDYRRSSLRCATPTSATTRWGRKSPNCGPNWSSSRHTPRPRCRPRSPNAGTTAAGMSRPTCSWWSCSTSRTTPCPRDRRAR